MQFCTTKAHTPPPCSRVPRQSIVISNKFLELSALWAIDFENHWAFVENNLIASRMVLQYGTNFAKLGV
jgi:hypothetical protein